MLECVASWPQNPIAFYHLNIFKSASWFFIPATYIFCSSFLSLKGTGFPGQSILLGTPEGICFWYFFPPWSKAKLEKLLLFLMHLVHVDGVLCGL